MSYREHAGLLAALLMTGISPGSWAQGADVPECTDVQNSNDPCCSGSPPSYCPVNSQDPWDVAENNTADVLENYIIAAGLPDEFIGLPLASSIASSIAGYIVDQGRGRIEDLGGPTAGPSISLLMNYLPLIEGTAELSTLIATSIVSIGNEAEDSLIPNETYNIPYVATTDLIPACVRVPDLHKDRNFNHSLMNPIVSTGPALVYKTNVGVPTEIHAMRPSWSTRQIWDHHWIWWFGDSSMVPSSSEGISGTNHVYTSLGDHELMFVMLENNLDFWFGFTSSDEDYTFGSFKLSVSLSDDDTPDACNYATMKVLPNNAPNAVISVSNMPEPNRKRFRATSSSDPDGNPLTYRWQFSDGSTATGAVVTRSFSVPRPRNMTATLTVSDGGRSDTTVRTFSVSPHLGCGPGTGQSCW